MVTVQNFIVKILWGYILNDFIHIELTGFTTDYYKDGQKFKLLIYQK